VDASRIAGKPSRVQAKRLADVDCLAVSHGRVSVVR
jgi:hypothetical protein